MIEVRKHSDFHIETKTFFPLSDKKKIKRDIHYYIYSPAQLQVNSSTLSRTEFLNMVSTYGRFGSPLLTFEELLDQDNKDSHLYKLIKGIEENNNEKSIISELQLLSNAIRHESKAHTKSTASYVKQRNFIAVETVIIDFTISFQTLLDRLRNIICNTEIKNENIKQALVWTDEHLSIVGEKEANAMNKLLYKNEKEYEKSKKRLKDFILSEENYRANNKYLTAMQDEKTSLERATYRASMLKKWAQSVLYLTPVESNSPKHAGQIIAGFAAAIAMTFATLASIFAEIKYSKNSYQWALIIIIAYVFKDRIKEWLRAILNKLLPRLLADSIYTFVEPSEERRICKSKVQVNVKKARFQDDKIKTFREKDENPFRSVLPDEDVIHFSRYINISKQKKKKDLCSSTFTLINRIRLDDFTKEMDNTNPLRKIADPDVFESNRVYHLHLLVNEVNISENIDELQHYLIVMNKEGIQRLEKLF